MFYNCQAPNIFHVYTAEHEQHLRELKLPSGAARTALLTFIPSHPANHTPTNGTRNAQRLFPAPRDNICRYGEMIDGIQFAKATAAAVKWVTECALWIGEGLVDLGEALWEWGKSAARDPAGAWEGIKEAVVEALNFILDFILYTFEIVFKVVVRGLMELGRAVLNPLFSTVVSLQNRGSSVTSDDLNGLKAFTPPSIPDPLNCIFEIVAKFKNILDFIKEQIVNIMVDVIVSIAGAIPGLSDFNFRQFLGLLKNPSSLAGNAEF